MGWSETENIEKNGLNSELINKMPNESDIIEMDRRNVGIFCPLQAILVKDMSDSL